MKKVLLVVFTLFSASCLAGGGTDWPDPPVHYFGGGADWPDPPANA